jgi:hypothetical protein
VLFSLEAACTATDPNLNSLANPTSSHFASQNFEAGENVILQHFSLFLAVGASSSSSIAMSSQSGDLMHHAFDDLDLIYTTKRILVLNPPDQIRGSPLMSHNVFVVEACLDIDVLKLAFTLGSSLAASAKLVANFSCNEDDRRWRDVAVGCANSALPHGLKLESVNGCIFTSVHQRVQ